MDNFNPFFNIFILCCFLSCVVAPDPKGFPGPKTPGRNIFNRLKQGRTPNLAADPLEPRVPRFGNSSSSNAGPVFQRLGGGGEKSSHLSSITSSDFASCGITYIVEGGQGILLYSFYDRYAYNCEIKFQTANVDTTTLRLYCPNFALKFNCFFEQLKIGVDGSETIYCRDDEIPEMTGEEFTVTYQRNLIGFNGGYVCILQADEEKSADFTDTESKDDEAKCGITAAMETKSNDNQRVVGGINADKHAHPWMAYLKMNVGNYGMEYRCGGSLFTDRHIISAAHCFSGYKINYVDVGLGKHDTSTISEDGSTWRKTTQYVVHPNYDDALIMNDIAIVILDEAVTFTEAIRPICLPPADGLSLDDKAVTASGWGATSYGGYEADILQEVALTVQSNSDCEDDWQKKFNDDYFFIFDSQLCAMKPGKDTCSGDSGGPLIYKGEDDESWVLVGITSFGYKCADPDVAGVYTRVSKYIGWINKQVEEN